jgi:hypothetical protein
MEIVYRAKDGTIFETEVRCREYELQDAVELLFNKEIVTTAPGFRTAIIQFRDYVKNVLDGIDTITQEEAPAEKPIPAFVPVFSEEKARERDHESAKEAIEEYLEGWGISDIEDLEGFFDDRREALAAYFGFHF